MGSQTRSSKRPDNPRLGDSSVAVRLLLTLLFVVGATGVAVGLSLGLEVDGLQILFLVPVLAAAVAFGLWYGFVAALLSVAASSYVIRIPGEAWRLGGLQDVLNLVLFVAAAWIAGLYTDTVRRRQQAARTLLEAGHGLTAHAEGPALGQFYSSVAEQTAPHPQGSMLNELRRAAASAGLVLAASGGAVLAQGPLGSGAVIALLLVAVVATAAMFGARFAYAVGVAATLAQNVIAGGAPWMVHVGSVDSLLYLAVFAGVGGYVGLLSDRISHERQAIQTLFTASRTLSASTGEAPLRAQFFEAVVNATRGGSVRLADEGGVTHHERLGGAPPPPIGLEQLDPNQTLLVGPWRLRRMAIDGRDIGVLAWRYNRLAQQDCIALDQVVAAIADLGASAIMRARLTAEKAEMEFVARTEQLRTILLDAVSHHFRTPLTSIIGSVTNLLDPADQHAPPARREFLLIIREQANRLNRYVENFLGVARLESGEIHIRPQSVDIEPLLYDVWESFGEAGGARRFLEVDLVDAPVLADPAPLKQVLGNLLENAIKFSAEGSVVSVRGHVADENLAIEVADEGCGVPDADRERIFERFYRSRGAKVPGLGLGLYITKNLVELMGGEIVPRARGDGRPGLVMSISLPLAEPVT